MVDNSGVIYGIDDLEEVTGLATRVDTAVDKETGEVRTTEGVDGGRRISKVVIWRSTETEFRSADAHANQLKRSQRGVRKTLLLRTCTMV